MKRKGDKMRRVRSDRGEEFRSACEASRDTLEQYEDQLAKMERIINGKEL